MASRLAVFGVVCGVALATVPLRASTVVGVFAIIDRVQLEPDDVTPERIRISGVFVVPVPVSSGLHKEPERGHLCFSLPRGMEEAARKDWTALQAAAGTGQVVGFGKYWVVTARSANSTANTSLVVHINGAADTSVCDPYPEPNERGIVTSFDTPEDANPRFGQPSLVIVSKLLEAYKQ